MKQLLNVGLYIAALIMLASCTKDNTTNFVMEKPQSVAVQDSVDNNYSPLKSYVENQNTTFKVGAGISASAYADQGAIYGLVNSNFLEVTPYGISHGDVVQADGSLNLDSMNSFMAAARQAGISVFGNAIISPQNENESYLNELIAPETVSVSEPSWELVSEADFETDNASNYQSNNNAVTSFTAEGEGFEGDGRALKVVNAEVRDNDWQSQLFMTFEPKVEAGDQFRFVTNVRAEQDVSFSTQAHRVPYEYLHWDFFGTISASSEWSVYERQITVSEQQAGAGTIAFNLGATATTYYFDNMQVWYYNTEGGTETVEKTPEEKQEILSFELESWVSSIVDTASSINAWNVVNGAIASGSENGYELKSDGSFNWQEYLGPEYGVQAFQVAREHAGDDAILFISDTGLENLSKTHGLLNYVEYIESNGATVDGIGTHLNISINTSKQDISEMFELLEATGKMVKISGLTVGLGGVSAGVASPELYQAQADMYQFVVDEYFSIVPGNQQYGITVWNPLDSADNPAGLWTQDYVRKRAYAGFASGIMNGLNSGN
ncbi:endo-1,4-beta-xylanase [Rhodohalobacter sp. 8-1]|uniref:endo-1,4-beta-xylanase n=1 Tax=Rhodohalobacter sp. 8-1 TaxID=3131972 RepID=UPI0030EBE706